MTKVRRKFDANYKMCICELIRQQALKITQVCADNRLGVSTIHHWLSQYDADPRCKAGIELQNQWI